MLRRLLLNPDSLCAQLLQANYFPDGDVLNAKAKRGMSYAWRSILSGMICLKRVVVWRVGDGSSIKIWEDPWLPREHTRRPFMPCGNCLLKRVEELIDPILGTWDETLVQDLFGKMMPN